MSDIPDNIVDLKKYIESNIEDSDKYTTQHPLLTKMNNKHAFIESIGGKPMVASYVYNETVKDEILEFVTPESILTRYCNETVQEGKSQVALGKWWLHHTDRKQYKTIIFDPSAPKEHNGCLNLWEGFAVTPKQKNNGWKWTLKHIYKIQCNSNPEKFNYVIKWLAWCLQNPAERPQVSIIFKGKQGAGKGFIFDYFCKIFGQHSMNISNRELLTGKYNGHLYRLVFLFADEAYYPGDREVEGVMKELITQEFLTYRHLYKEAIKGANRLHIAQSTNSEWVIPAGDDTRRYFINAVDNKYAKGQANNLLRDLYFSRLFAEMNHGGCEAMLYDLLNMNLYDWHPIRDVPNTEELIAQIKLTKTNLQSAIFSILDDGIFPGILSADGEYEISATGFYNYLHETETNTKNISMNKKADLVKKLGAEKRRINTGIVWVFPELNAMRENWDKMFGKFKWDRAIKWQIVKSQY